MVELTILGTASMVPTKERNVQAFYLEFEGEGMLFDCGEGTQRQMNIAGLSRAKIRRIFITHWHGDHVAGLLGLIQTMGNGGYEGTLNVYGPRGTKEFFFHLMNATIFENRMDISVHDLPGTEDEHVVAETDKYVVTCLPVDHGVPSLAYAWKEKDRTKVDMGVCAKLGLTPGPLIGKLTRGESIEFNGKHITPKDVTYKITGKKITFIPDTQPHPNLEVIAHGADLLVCESTYCEAEEDKAQQNKHMTASATAQVASRADVKRLLLTHFSQRYPTVSHLVEEARAVFPQTDAAFDLMHIKL